MCTFMCIYLFSCPSVPASQLLIFHREYLVWCINHNCYLYMPSWDPDLVNKLISISISISYILLWGALSAGKTTCEYGSSSIWYHQPRADNWNYLHLRWLSVWEFKSIVIRLWSEVNDCNHSVTLATCDWHHCICTSFPPYSTYNVNVTYL